MSIAMLDERDWMMIVISRRMVLSTLCHLVHQILQINLNMDQTRYKIGSSVLSGASMKSQCNFQETHDDMEMQIG